MANTLFFCWIWSIQRKKSKCKAAAGDYVNFQHCYKEEGEAKVLAFLVSIFILYCPLCSLMYPVIPCVYKFKL